MQRTIEEAIEDPVADVELAVVQCGWWQASSMTRGFADPARRKLDWACYRDRLRATSPRHHAEKIQIPIMLAHGSEDRVVPIEQSEVMAEALEMAGKSFKFLVFDDGDHYLSKEEYRVRLFRMMEIFLARNLTKPSNLSETPGSPAESSK